jgi:hypothetical protein
MTIDLIKQKYPAFIALHLSNDKKYYFDLLSSFLRRLKETGVMPRKEAMMVWGIRFSREG